MSGMCLEYVFRVILSYVLPVIYFPSHLVMSGICLVYVWDILSESFGHMSGIYLTNSFACEPLCSSNAIGRLLGPLRHKDCECCHGCLMFSSKRGRHVEHWPCQDWSMSRTSMTPYSCQQRVSRLATWSVLRGDLARHCLALGDGENVRVGADSAGAASVRAAQAPARTCTMWCLEVTGNPQTNR
jgi:hypothetical protein